MAELISLSTLERAPARALDLLLGMADAAIWQKMTANGLTTEDVAAGTKMLQFLLPGPLPIATPPVPPEVAKKRAAIAEVTAADEYILAKYRPLAQMFDVGAARWLFDGLEAEPTPEASIKVVYTVLTRAEALEQGRVSHLDGTQMLEQLAARGFSPEYRAHLRSQIEVALSADPGKPPAELHSPSPEERVQALTELHYWWHAIAAIARTAGLKKGQLIRLGLANRRPNGATTADPHEGDGTSQGGSPE